ncbi:uncharacterized protein EV422DRAFT_507954 [Fimicolochytrium jonesii]|uniref:uncharacterized protein n=1 Tax=Fimicolochytrium jonesii TaxID=1396493 RepID=UPI0022FDB7D3|nr:uncharacterized protein EV422DRAFT_507954 [Fimicolochytrium jonesii]KAI8818795.1 hypothetical protein EV422DRAFT_507954 [Fimicolochytrium jonesii]
MAHAQRPIYLSLAWALVGSRTRPGAGGAAGHGGMGSVTGSRRGGCVLTFGHGGAMSFHVGGIDDGASMRSFCTEELTLKTRFLSEELGIFSNGEGMSFDSYPDVACKRPAEVVSSPHIRAWSRNEILICLGISPHAHTEKGAEKSTHIQELELQKRWG